jgi:hypothetical protein
VAGGDPLRPRLSVHPIGASTVLVTYTSAVRHEAWDYANRSSIWVRDAGTWRLRFHQATPTNPQPSAPGPPFPCVTLPEIDREKGRPEDSSRDQSRRWAT